MKRNYLTIILIVIAVVLSGFRFHHRAIRPPQYGIPITLVHNCSNEEALRELGDDREIIVTSKADGSIAINETPFTPSTVGPELAKIFESRTPKLVWFIGDPRLNYGQAVTNLSALHAETSNFVIALPTTTQIAAAKTLSNTESQCPYGP